MNKLIILMLLAIFSFTYADNKFEINQKNCNLPMKKIKELVPDEKQQRIIYLECVRKAAKEKWPNKKLINR